MIYKNIPNYIIITYRSWTSTRASGRVCLSGLAIIPGIATFGGTEENVGRNHFAKTIQVGCVVQCLGVGARSPYAAARYGVELGVYRTGSNADASAILTGIVLITGAGQRSEGFARGGTARIVQSVEAVGLVGRLAGLHCVVVGIAGRAVHLNGSGRLADVVVFTGHNAAQLGTGRDRVTERRHVVVAFENYLLGQSTGAHQAEDRRQKEFVCHCYLVIPGTVDRTSIYQ